MIITKLMEHQKLVVDFCMDKEYAGIFSDYGTGKTLCALSIIERKGYRKILVVSTKLAIKVSWADEIRKHTDFRFCILEGTRKKKVELLNYALSMVSDPKRYVSLGNFRPMLILINFEGIRNIFKELQDADFDAVFVDESTKIKVYNAKRTLALQKLGEYIPHRYIMTGFPVTENLSDLYSQIKFLDHGKAFGNSYYAFLNRFFVRYGYKVVVRKNSIKKILQLISGFCIRITNKMLKLPPVIYKEVIVDKTEEQEKVLESFIKTFKLELGRVKIDTKFIFTLISKSLEICDGFIQSEERDEEGKIIKRNIEVLDTNKDEVLVELLDEIDIRKNKVVIWCAYLFSVNKIVKLLEKLNIPCVSLTGETEDVNKAIRKFQHGSVNVLVATLRKASESITLTECKYAIYYSNIWSFDLRGNSEARIRRKGSEKHDSVMYIDLITKNTIEKKVYDCLRKKKDLVNELKKEFLIMKGDKNVAHISK